MKQIDICMKQENLNYYANAVAAEFYRFMTKNKIDENDENNKYVVAKKRAVTICNCETYGNDDYDALIKIEKELDELRNMIR